jgi:hypothetical protein
MRRKAVYQAPSGTATGLAGATAHAGGHIAAAAGGDIINTGGITALLGTVLIIIVLTIAIRHAMHAGRGNWSMVLTGMGVLALAAMTWALASGNDIGKLGTDLVSRVLSL